MSGYGCKHPFDHCFLPALLPYTNELPLHLGPLPPPFTPNFVLTPSPASLTFFSSDPNIRTTLVLVLVWEEGEDDRTIRYGLSLGGKLDNVFVKRKQLQIGTQVHC